MTVAVVGVAFDGQSGVRCFVGATEARGLSETAFGVSVLGPGPSGAVAGAALPYRSPWLGEVRTSPVGLGVGPDEIVCEQDPRCLALVCGSGALARAIADPRACEWSPVEAYNADRARQSALSVVRTIARRQQTKDGGVQGYQGHPAPVVVIAWGSGGPGEEGRTGAEKAAGAMLIDQYGEVKRCTSHDPVLVVGTEGEERGVAQGCVLGALAEGAPMDRAIAIAIARGRVRGGFPERELVRADLVREVGAAPGGTGDFSGGEAPDDG